MGRKVVIAITERQLDLDPMGANLLRPIGRQPPATRFRMIDDEAALRQIDIRSRPGFIQMKLT